VPSPARDARLYPGSVTDALALADAVRSVIAECGLPEDLEPLLVARVARATELWPGIALAPDALVRAIVERLSRDDPARSLEAMHSDDVYFACGCAAGDPAALAGFEDRCGAALAAAIASAGVPAADRADVAQIVRQRLLVAPQGGPPRIASYSGRGSLHGWVRVVATREALRMLSREGREIPAGDSDLDAAIDREDNAELSYLKRLYREEFKSAFHAAVEALDARSRLLLRQHAVDGLSIDRLAALHSVHRATAARWVQAAREEVLTGTQRELARRLRLTKAELVSVIRLIQTQLDVSLPDALRR
jgi:RNA polymerase sigma-70 factor (ECF subfamily)